MKYTFKIDNYNKTEGFVGVVYIPEDQSLRSHFIRVPVDDDTTPAILQERIRECAPVEFWKLESDKKEIGIDIEKLVGSAGMADEKDTISARQVQEDKISVDDIFNFALEGLGGELAELRELVDNRYPHVERDTWGSQREEANHILSGGEAGIDTTPYLSKQAVDRAVDIVELATTVLRKARERDALLSELISAYRTAQEAHNQIRTEWEANTISRRLLVEKLRSIQLINYTTSFDISTVG